MVVVEVASDPVASDSWLFGIEGATLRGGGGGGGDVKYSRWIGHGGQKVY